MLFLQPPYIATLGLGLALCISIPACTPAQMKKSSDREVLGILKRKTSAVPNAGDHLLDVEAPPPISLAGFKTSSKSEAFLGDRAHLEKDAKVVPLHEALRLAVTHNRDYLTRKEDLFTQALDLTLVRHQFAPIFTGGSDATIARDRGTTSSRSASGGLSSRAVQGEVNQLVSENTFTTTSNLGASVLTQTGARIAADFTTDFLRLVSGNLRGTSNSQLAFTLTQPLLRGAGYRATMESLTQAERDLLYAIRDFTQYRKTFTVDITSSYYRTLEARRVAQNAFTAYDGFQLLITSERAFAAEGKRTASQLGLIEQAALKYQRLWINAIRNYENQLDTLKISLGVPVETPLLLDEKELEKLKIEQPGFPFDASMDVAQTSRLDLDNSRNAVEDSDRKIALAKQNLLPQLDLVGGYQLHSEPDSRRVSLSSERQGAQAGVNLDLRLDKKADRNTFRSALLTRQRATRDLDLAEETVRASLRTDWRDLDTAGKQYELAVRGVELSERLLEQERMLNELNRGSTRDLIDAQQDLLEARDALTSALINHNLARLRLWKDMGVLFIQKDGTWASVLSKEAE